MHLPIIGAIIMTIPAIEAICDTTPGFFDSFFDDPHSRLECLRLYYPEAYCSTMSSKYLHTSLPTPTDRGLAQWARRHSATATKIDVEETDVPARLRGDFCNFDAQRARWYNAHAVPLANECAGRAAVPTGKAAELKLSPHTTTSAWCGACVTCTRNAAVPRQTVDARMAGAMAVGGAALALL